MDRGGLHLTELGEARKITEIMIFPSGDRQETVWCQMHGGRCNVEGGLGEERGGGMFDGSFRRRACQERERGGKRERDGME